MSCWSCWSRCCCYCCWTSAVVSSLYSLKPSERHRKDVRADSKDLDVGWAGGQGKDHRLARCQRGSSASLAQKISVDFSLSAYFFSCLLVFFLLCNLLLRRLLLASSSLSCSLLVLSACLQYLVMKKSSANLALPCCITIVCWGPASKRRLKKTHLQP